MRDSFLSRAETFLFGRRPTGHVPARVQTVIAGQQRRGEVLIGWAQMALVLFFSALYAAAPQAEGNVAADPVPFALAAYFLFTALRIALAHSRGLNHAFLYASVVADMAFLMTLIWSFHIKYDQPASFYLKAPTLLYVFIFIALRTLRFEPRFVLASGFAAAAGWAALLAIALTSSHPALLDRMGNPVTRNYVEYMTSNRVLIGAEIDKIISILVVTAVLATALVRARRLMVHAATGQAAASDLSRLVAPEIAARVISADESVRPGHGELREVTILFTDVAGFSTLSEPMSPNVLVGILNDYYATLTDIVRKHGGVVNQMGGDAMLVTFNAARANETHARDAVRAAIEIVETCSEKTFGDGYRLPTRVGINTGAVTVGAVGGEHQMWFTVHGDAVNVASRLEQMNKEFGTWILLSGETAHGAGSDFTFRPMGETVVRGRKKPTAVYTVG